MVGAVWCGDSFTTLSLFYLQGFAIYGMVGGLIATPQ